MMPLRSESMRTPVEWMASIEAIQHEAMATITDQEKRRLSQYFTPLDIAAFMASMIPDDLPADIHLLDAGAGAGTLFAAAVNELCLRSMKPSSIRVTAYEIDASMATRVRRAMQWCAWRCKQESIRFSGDVRCEDFIDSTVVGLQGDLFGSRAFPPFNLAILNPPYKKMGASSHERRTLSRIGIEETNLYTAFLALTLDLLSADGALIAITPRSFCNGSYFRRFRRRFNQQASIQRMHIFDTRNTVFSRDSVLQETLILSARKTVANHARTSVLVSSSLEADGSGALMQRVPYDKIIKPHDATATIHVPMDSLSLQVMTLLENLPCSLSDLNLEVSTGRVVEFRVREYLRTSLDPDCVPLIAARHLVDGYVIWPRPRRGRPEALQISSATVAQVIPASTYTLVKRTTAKEEKRRVAAAVYAADPAGGSVAFENHINYFHQHGSGLEPDLAFGLAAYLNSTLVDSYIRQFNGHTQINATDLRALRYPSANDLCEIGRRVRGGNPSHNTVDQTVDQHVQGVLKEMAEASGIDPVLARRRIEEAVDALRQLGFPRAQQNERSALTLLALLDLSADRPWSMASAPLRGVTQLMEYMSDAYGKTYAPNSRETVRRQTLHQFVDLALARINPDLPDRSTNSGKTVYQIEENSLATLRTFGSSGWDAALQRRKDMTQELTAKYAQERLMVRIPLKRKDGVEFNISPGGQNVLIERIISEFAERFIPDGLLIYLGDAASKVGYLDEEALTALGVHLDIHGKAPDVIVYDEDRKWLGLIEAVTSHGPINIKRKLELEHLFAGCAVPLVFITAFLTRKSSQKYMPEIAWETEVWLADEPSHLIHFDGIQRLEPYQVGLESDSDEEE